MCVDGKTWSWLEIVKVCRRKVLSGTTERRVKKKD